ncbi:hypothetical protein KC349_g237 [Hortaea werneckii]|nr:hypothetical protein KC349_g237 [Hortaea werneckii]
MPKRRHKKRKKGTPHKSPRIAREETLDCMRFQTPPNQGNTPEARQDRGDGRGEGLAVAAAVAPSSSSAPSREPSCCASVFSFESRLLAASRFVRLEAVERAVSCWSRSVREGSRGVVRPSAVAESREDRPRACSSAESRVSKSVTLPSICSSVMSPSATSRAMPLLSSVVVGLAGTCELRVPCRRGISTDESSLLRLSTPSPSSPSCSPSPWPPGNPRLKPLLLFLPSYHTSSDLVPPPPSVHAITQIHIPSLYLPACTCEPVPRLGRSRSSPKANAARSVVLRLMSSRSGLRPASRRHRGRVCTWSRVSRFSDAVSRAKSYIRYALITMFNE